MWRDLIGAVIEQTDAAFGEPVLYTCDGHATVSVSVPFERAYQDVKIEDGQEITSTRPMVHVPVSALPADPAEGDSFTCRGVSYTVTEVRLEDDDTALCFAVVAL